MFDKAGKPTFNTIIAWLLTNQLHRCCWHICGRSIFSFGSQINLGSQFILLAPLTTIYHNFSSSQLSSDLSLCHRPQPFSVLKLFPLLCLAFLHPTPYLVTWCWPSPVQIRCLGICFMCTNRNDLRFSFWCKAFILTIPNLFSFMHSFTLTFFINKLLEVEVYGICY